MAWTRGVESGIPCTVVVKSFSACFTRSIVAGATSVVDVVVGGVVEVVDRLEAVALAFASSVCASASSFSAPASLVCESPMAVAADVTESRGSRRSSPNVLTSPTVAASSVKVLPYRSRAAT